MIRLGAGGVDADLAETLPAAVYLRWAINATRRRFPDVSHAEEAGLKSDLLRLMPYAWSPVQEAGTHRLRVFLRSIIRAAVDVAVEVLPIEQTDAIEIPPESEIKGCVPLVGPGRPLVNTTIRRCV